MAKRSTPTRGKRAMSDKTSPKTTAAQKPKWQTTRPIHNETGNSDIGPDGYEHPVPGDYIKQQLAPYPAIDRYPLRVGQNRTLAYLSSAMRLATIGYRMQWVDLLGEILEQDPHMYGALAKRALGVARGKIIIAPADLGNDPSDEDTKLARKICDEVSARFFAIARLKTELTRLCWAMYYGIGACEITWQHGSDWRPTALNFIHSRRLAMPEWSQWKLFIWDQGPVSPWESFQFPTQAPLGLCIDELPGKFLVHCPPVRGEYPTREGLGFELAHWAMIKHVAARAAPIYLERFSKPIPEAIFSRGKDANGNTPPADRRDIANLASAMLAIAAGTQQSITHPDTIELQFNLPQGGKSGAVRYGEWIDICDAQMSVAINGNTLNAKAGGEGNGSRALGDTQRKDQINTWGADADALGESLRESIIKMDVKLNYPRIDLARFCPQVTIGLEDDPDPTVIATRAGLLANAGYPVDATKLEEMVGIPLADYKDPHSIVMVPLKPQELIPPVRPSDPDEQAETLAAVADAKANPPTPVIAPPGAGGGLRGMPGGKAPAAAKPSAEKVRATDHVPFAARNAAFLADVREMRDLGFEPDVERLAAQHGVDVPTKKAK